MKDFFRKMKHTTLICIVQVSVVLDSSTIQIYEGCQQKINLIGHLRKNLLTVYDLRRKGLFSIKN